MNLTRRQFVVATAASPVLLLLHPQKHPCHYGDGERQCRYLDVHSYSPRRYSCRKLCPDQRPKIDNEIALYLASLASTQGLPLGDNCPGVAPEILF